MMTDYRRDPSEWLAAVQALDSHASRLPDGAARVTAFHQNLRLTDQPDTYITRELVVRDGVIVMRVAPGPVTAAFLAELEAIA
ncbi:hypothetical protein [Falsirhodobacter halotolerans]|uniref:hypothetical protein n=1 Tax=Falsirhodobacter halotolerans TaxID=1146892 RepID=UPI001FD52CE2|nr:hypothetical protein [Falsirhodobacter halotolerans]MCJ8139372.1 hypothetical protein [Falsirhodobacter halotolerans]